MNNNKYTYTCKRNKLSVFFSKHLIIWSSVFLIVYVFYEWWINIFYGISVDKCKISGYSYQVYTDLIQEEHKYLCIPTLLVDYEFGGDDFSNIQTRTLEKPDINYAIIYSKFTDVEMENCIDYYRNNKDYSIGTKLTHCKTTYKHKKPLDNCLCQSDYFGVSQGTRTNGCCDYGFVGYFSRFIFIYTAVLVSISIVLFTIWTFLAIKWFFEDYMRYKKETKATRKTIELNNIVTILVKNANSDDHIINIENPIDKKRNRIFKEEKCVVCDTNMSNIVFMECQHMCVCDECYARMNKICPICKETIKYIVKV